MQALIRRGALVVVLLAIRANALGESHLMRMADVSADQIVFTYEDDLWSVPLAGGTARRLTNDPGIEMWAKFSPDGKQLAFTAQYDGGLDVYVMPAGGGEPVRLTYHPAADRVLGWWPDGEWIYFRSTRAYPFRGEELYRVSPRGGPTERVPVDRAGLTAVSPDGKHIAYNRISREAATWKRHQGGTAQDIWMGSLETQDYRKITDWIGTDNFPMWAGDAIYFTSDRENDTLNICRFDVPTGKTTVLTHYEDFDVKYPSMGPAHIVFQYGETLHLLDLASGRTQAVPVEIPSDRVRMRDDLVSVSPSTGSFSLSPTGTRMLLEARGEILNLPVKDGDPVNLTQTAGAREKNAAWSPNGRWIAFISDKSGEEEVYLVDQKRAQEWRQLTQGGLGFRLQLVWSPDSKHLLFSDKFMKLNLVDAETGKITVVDQADYDEGWERWGIQDYIWSPDGRWIAYTKMEQSLNDSIFLYSLEEQKSHRLTSDQTSDWSPSFDPEGRYLYFLSNRTFNPVMCFQDQNHVFLEMGKPYVMLLQADGPVPFPLKDSSETVKEESQPADEKQSDTTSKEATAKEDKKDEKEAQVDKEDSKKKTKIDLDGIQRRFFAAENVPAGNYFRLEATPKGFYYLKRDENQFEKYQVVTDHTGGALDLYHYDLEKKSPTKVMGGITNYHQSADGKKMVYRAGTTYGVLDVAASGGVGDGKVDYSRVRLDLDRAAEYLQMFNEAWRIQRDWFYDPKLHGVDWEAIGAQYRALVPYCGTRGDLTYLIGEMIGELNIGHTYVYGGETVGPRGKSINTGMLGGELIAEPGCEYYRVGSIVPNNPSDPGERSPLGEPGCPIQVGHYILAVDGTPITTCDDFYKALRNKADAIVAMTYNDQPTLEGAKVHRLKTIGSENAIRYREWVEKNKQYVDEQTGGQVGYLHIPDMGAGGCIEFAKYWYPQYYKKAFIIDERYNGGGFTADMIIDRLERQLWALTQPREGKVLRDPERCFAGPMVVLINEDTGSNGEFFAEAMKVKQLAPVIGMRTWGGAIGIEPHQDLVDGGTVTPPQFGLYGLDRKWLIEGTGVVPDIEVQNMPYEVWRGQDAQLDKAIAHVQELLETGAVEIPPVPDYPVKAKRIHR